MNTESTQSTQPTQATQATQAAQPTQSTQTTRHTVGVGGSSRHTVGVAGIGLYLPKQTMSAEEIAAKTNGVWTAENVRQKLGIRQIYVAGPDEGTQEMGALAALDCIENSGIDPLAIDLILCFGEEWKEYPLTTSALYIQDRVGADNAWGIDVQNRCCTTISALKMARDMMMGDDDLKVVLLAGGYRNGDFVDFADKDMSMMYNLSAGGGALLLVKDHPENEVLGSSVMSDGSLARTAGVEIGGIMNPITQENLEESRKSLRLMDPVKMKNRLNEVSMSNWYACIDKALEQSGLTREDIDYLNVLHMKRSGHLSLLAEFGLSEDQSTYLEDYGHLGQIDMILSLKLGLDRGKIREGSIVCSIAAGIGYVWAANIIRWGKNHG